MGCGISTLDAKNSSMSPRSIRATRHPMVPPVVIEKKQDFENVDEDHVGLMHGNHKNNNNNNNKDFVMEMKPLGHEETKYINEAPIGRLERNNNKEEERVFGNEGKEKHSDGDDKHCAKNVEEEHEDRDYIHFGPGSPSFREYCNNYDCGDRTSVGDSNDCDSMDHVIKKGSDNDSSNKNNMSNIEGSVNSNKEREKKERKGRGFKNVINKGKSKREEKSSQLHLLQC